MRPEDTLQKACVNALKPLEALGLLAYAAVPNEAKRSFKLAGLMKAKGLRKGFPDLMILCPDGRAAFVELKASAKDKPGPEQDIWLKRLQAMGFVAFVCTSVDELMGVVDALIGRRRA